VTALTLRTKFLLIVLGGAVLPLAVVGLWLTGSASRSGRALLRTQLDAAVGALASDANDKWLARSGELQLLASNTVIQTMMSAPTQTASPADSAYLGRLMAEFGLAIPSVRYVDARGRVRWSYDDTRTTARSGVPQLRASIDDARPPEQSRADAPESLPTVFPVDIPVRSESGLTLGTLHARVRLSTVLRPDSARSAVPGAVLQVLDASGALVSSPLIPPGLVDARAADSWEVVTRALDAPLRLMLAGPVAPFVQPFERAARAGLGVLMGVALTALFVSAVLTTRVMRSVERMAIIAESVAGGDLHGRVEVTGRDEIGRLAASFNAMTESLRRTLAELSQQRAMAAVGEFAASLSHEVRNALTAMRIDLQHATRQLPPDSSATPLVARTLESVRRLDSTVTGALRLARSGHAQEARIELTALLRRAMASAEPTFAASSATLEPLSIGSEVVYMDGDASALEQLFLNLMMNAGQALRPGGRTVVDLCVQREAIVVRIADNGPGLPPGAVAEASPMLFSTKPDGTGLGLPIARRIAAALGGSLVLADGETGGVVATVTLPLRRTC
jgi:signal transduction histidine kinase